MLTPIAFTTAQLSGPCRSIETVGQVSDFSSWQWPVGMSDCLYWHDSRGFVRILDDSTLNPESGGNFSWLYRKSRWEALLDYEQSRFGTFGEGDLLRITEDFFAAIGNRIPRTPGWHRDHSHPLQGRAAAPNPHMYLIGGEYPVLNTEIALAADGPDYYRQDFLDKNSKGSCHDHSLTAYFREHGGTRQLASGEVVIMPLAQPHRTSPYWDKPHPGKTHEFGRLKVLRAAR